MPVHAVKGAGITAVTLACRHVHENRITEHSVPAQITTCGNCCAVQNKGPAGHGLRNLSTRRENGRDDRGPGKCSNPTLKCSKVAAVQNCEMHVNPAAAHSRCSRSAPWRWTRRERLSHGEAMEVSGVGDGGVVGRHGGMGAWTWGEVANIFAPVLSHARPCKARQVKKSCNVIESAPLASGSWVPCRRRSRCSWIG